MRCSDNFPRVAWWCVQFQNYFPPVCCRTAQFKGPDLAYPTGIFFPPDPIFVSGIRQYRIQDTEIIFPLYSMEARRWKTLEDSRRELADYIKGKDAEAI